MNDSIDLTAGWGTNSNDAKEYIGGLWIPVESAEQHRKQYLQLKIWREEEYARINAEMQRKWVEYCKEHGL